MKTRDRRAALKFLMKSMRRHGGSARSVTDLQRSYGSALKDLGRGNDREVWRWSNNLAENSHLAFRQRERAMLRFRRIGSLQEFATVHASVYNHVNQVRKLTSRDCYKANCAAARAEVALSPLCLTQTMVGANGSGVHFSLTAPPDPFACNDLWLRLAARDSAFLDPQAHGHAT